MHFNIINPEAIDLCLERSCPRLTSLLKQCLGRALRRDHWLLRIEHDYPSDPPAWLTPERFADGTVYYRFDGFNQQTWQQVLTVDRWLRNAIAANHDWLDDVDDGGRVRRLLNVGTLEHAVDLARKDEGADRKRLSALMRTLRESLERPLLSTRSVPTFPLLGTSEGSRTKPPYTLAHEAQQPRQLASKRAGNVEITLPDGRQWIRLTTAKALRSEALRMRSCVGNRSYVDGMSTGRWAFYSLRDASGRQSFVTAKIFPNGFCMALGHANATPREYQSAIDTLVAQLDAGRAAQLGTKPSKRREDWQRWWEDRCDTCPGDVTAMFKTEPLRFAHTIQIAGELCLAHHKGLVALPDILEVGRSLLLASCVNLQVMPRWMRVMGNVDLTACRSVTNLPDDIWVGHGLYLSGCTALKTLPTRLRVGGRLHLEGSAITRVPSSVHVGDGIAFGKFIFPTADDANHYLRRAMPSLMIRAPSCPDHGDAHDDRDA